MQALNSAVLLSRGGTWKPDPWEPPYLLADGGQPWPEGWASIVFTDSAGAEILTLDGTVDGDRIDFVGDPEEMDQVPAGAGYTIKLETPEAVHVIRYGTVIRKEVFWTQPAAKRVKTPRMFSDSFQRTALGRKWIPVVGRTVIRDNHLIGLPNGLGPEVAFFQKSAIRYWEEFTSDSVEVGVTVLNTDPILAGRTAVMIGADIGLTTGIAMRFETAAFANQLHLGMVNGPNSMVDETAAVANVVRNGDYYRLRYTDSTKIAAVYKGSSLEPIIEWPDAAGVVPHGRGYRHFGIAFESALVGRGIQITSITAMDVA